MSVLRDWLATVVWEFLNSDAGKKLILDTCWRNLIAEVSTIGRNDVVIITVPEGTREEDVKFLSEQMRQLLQHDNYVILSTERPVSFMRLA